MARLAATCHTTSPTEGRSASSGGTRLADRAGCSPAMRVTPTPSPMDSAQTWGLKEGWPSGKGSMSSHTGEMAATRPDTSR